MARLLAALVLAALAATAAPAHAGQVTIRACTVDGVRYDNRSWGLESPAPGIDRDDACPGVGSDNNFDLHVSPGSRTPEGAEAVYAFRAPEGTAIADFRLERRLIFQNATPDGAHPYYVLYTLGPTTFAGAGNYDEATESRLRAQRSWYASRDGSIDTGRDTVTRASFPALDGYRGDATTLALRIGCFKRGTHCATAQSARIEHAIAGAAVTVEDPVAPAELVVEASGLLAGGPRAGSDPVRIARATDNLGIRRAELLDVTDPAAPRVVGAEDYESTARTDSGAGCSYRLLHPCPNLAGESLTATALPAGRRQVAVRVTDPGGLSLTSAPYTVDVATPSDRGAANGLAATEGGTLTAAFAPGGARRIADHGAGVTIAGRLVNDAGAPVVNAELRVITLDADRDQPVDRGAIHTDGAGAFRYQTTASVGRLLQFAWRARANDPGFALNAYVRLRVRATATLRTRRTVALRRRLVLRGQLKGRRSQGVDVVLQGRRKGTKRWRTFDEARTRAGGRFTAAYRFLRTASRGRTFYIRAKILPTGRYPYVRGYSRTAKVRVR